MTREEPFRQEFHFAQQQRAVIARQISRDGRIGGLHRAQAFERIGIQLIGGTVQTQGIEVLPRTQIRQQQKPRSMSRARMTGTFRFREPKTLATFKERARIFLVGRRIHHNVGVSALGDAKISAKARIRGRGCDRCAGKTQILEHPLRQIRQAGIACIQYIHA